MSVIMLPLHACFVSILEKMYALSQILVNKKAFQLMYMIGKLTLMR